MLGCKRFSPTKASFAAIGYRPGLAEALFGTSARVELGYPGKTGRLIIPTMLRVFDEMASRQTRHGGEATAAPLPPASSRTTSRGLGAHSLKTSNSG